MALHMAAAERLERVTAQRCSKRPPGRSPARRAGPRRSPTATGSGGPASAAPARPVRWRAAARPRHGAGRSRSEPTRRPSSLNLITPKAVREIVEIINDDIRLRGAEREPAVKRATAAVRDLQKQDANLRRALRSARPNAAERITLEIDEVAAELRQAQHRLEQLEEVQQPMSVTPKLIRDTIAEMSGLLEHAALDTRVAWVRDLFDRIDVDSREERAVAVWRSPSDEAGVNRLDSVSGWLRR